MENQDRQEEILYYLKTRGFATVSEIAAVIFTSEATVRRDLKQMENKGYVARVYGGVTLPEYSAKAVPVYLRDGANAAAKEQIAEKAATLVQDNSIILLDSSTTARRICKHILHHKNLTVITNNLRVCKELKDSDVRVYCTGGYQLPRRECLVGHFAEEFLRNVRADMLFFSAQGVSTNGDITDSSEEEIALRHAMFACADQTVFLYDQSKAEKRYSFLLCNTDDATYVINENTDL